MEATARLHPAEGADAGHLDERDVLADRLREPAPGVVRPGRGGQRRARQLDRSPGGRVGAGRPRRARAADLQGPARDGLGVLQARRPAPPPLRGLQLVPRALREEGPGARRGVLRRYVAAVREEIGRDHFLLACWGVRPELVGLVDGCRIGTDGFSYAGLAQFNSFNNVVWRNDPDHIELSEKEAWRSTMVTSLTGSLFLLTDKPERYRTAFVEPARRAAPVLVDRRPASCTTSTRRGRPSWGAWTAEVSGRDPKPFDAGLTPSAHLYLLEINRPFESWVVLGRTGGDLRRDPAGTTSASTRRSATSCSSSGSAASWRPRASSFAPGPISRRRSTRRSSSSASGLHTRRSSRRAATSPGGGVDLLDVAWKDGVLSRPQPRGGRRAVRDLRDRERRVAAGRDAVRRGSGVAGRPARRAGRGRVRPDSVRRDRVARAVREAADANLDRCR